MTNPRLNNEDVDVEELETEFGYDLFEPELRGDDIEDAAQIPETVQLLLLVDMINNMAIQPILRFVKRGD